jgi:hypothetical protein
MNKRMSYEDWKKAVNQCLLSRYGIEDAEWLPDAPYARWYQERITPFTAAQKAFAHAQRY